MMLKRSLLLLTVLLFALAAMAQTGSSISGMIIDDESGEVLTKTIVYLQNTDYSGTTDDEGKFTIAGVPDGDYILMLDAEQADELQKKVTVAGAPVDLGEVHVLLQEGNSNVSAEDIIPTVSLSDNDIQGSGAQSVSGLLTASRDVFINTAAFTLGTYRFRIRGYDNNNTDIFLNGMMMNDLEDGGAYYSQWGGLNDVMRSRDNVIGLDPVDYTFGGVGGATSIDSRAGTQWDQLRLSYATSNRTYNHRLMGTYSTGWLKRGWAVSVSASRRWADEGYVDGTSYDAWSYFFAVEKKLGKDNRLGLTVMGAPVSRGKSGPAVEEAYDLAGSNFYNPNWGYQDGAKRNSRIAHSHLPTFILTDEWQINDRSSLYVSAGYQFGENGATSLNWYNAPDPRPDYYRNLPSYIEDPVLQEIARQQILDDPNILQLNWDELYQANYISSETIENFNGTGRDTTVNLSRYVIEDRRYDKQKAGLNIFYQNQLTSWFNLNVGANYNWQQTHNYKLLEDLLGGDVFIDRNQFAERDFRDNTEAIQNDLDNPNRLIKEGDKFGYDYNITVSKAGGFVNTKYTFDKFDAFVSGMVSYTQFFRTGNVRNGLFPDNSLGDDTKHDFVNYGVKGGVTYKLNGRNYFFANGGYLTRAPFAREAYLSPQTRNQVVDGLTSEKIATFEGGYLLKAPKMKARAVFYFTQFTDGMKSFNFYYDLERNFVNITLNNIDKRHMGGELAFEYEVYAGLKISAVSALGQNIYTSRQNATITLDNSAEVLAEDLTIYSNKFYVSNGPQFANTLGISYRAPKIWFAGINFNYFDQIYLDFNPIRRTNEAVDLVTPGSDLWNEILDQEQAAPQFTMDFFGGANWRLKDTFRNLKRPYFLNLTVGVSNLTNNTNFVTGGFEQTRLDLEENDVSRFPSRNFYAYGVNFFVSLAFRM